MSYINLTDQDAINTRGWLEEQDRKHPLHKTDGEIQAEMAARVDVKAYEKRKEAEGKPAYMLDPTLDYDSLVNRKQVLTGEKNVRGNVDRPITRQEIVDASWLDHAPAAFGVSLDEILANEDNFKARFMAANNADDLGSALMKDLDKRIERADQYDELVKFAHQHAISGEGDEADGFNAYMETKDEFFMPDEDMRDYFEQTHYSVKNTILRNEDDFKKLLSLANEELKDVKAFDPVNYLGMAMMLAEMPEETRRIALLYIDQNIEDQGSFKKLFEKGIQKSMLQKVNVDFEQLEGISNRILDDMVRGKDVYVKWGEGFTPIGVADRDMGGMEGIPTKIGSAIRVSKAINSFGINKPETWRFDLRWKKATKEQQEQLIRDTKDAAIMAETMRDMDAFMEKSLSDASKSWVGGNATMRSIMRDMVYPNAQTAADMSLLVAELYGMGKVSKLFQAGKTATKGETWLRRSLAGYMSWNASQRQLHTEHFEMLRREQPDLDPGLAYAISRNSSYQAAMFDGLMNLMVLDKIPGLRNTVSSVSNAKYVSKFAMKMKTLPWYGRFLKEGATVGIMETFTETLQSMSLDWTQQVMHWLDNEVPDIDTFENFRERIKEAPEIAIQMLPMAIIAGGGAALINPTAKHNIVTNRWSLENIAGIPPEATNKIISLAETDVEAAISLYEIELKKVGANKIADKLVESKEKGEYADKSFGKDVVEEAKDMDEAHNTGAYVSPRVDTVHDKDNNTTAWNVSFPDKNGQHGKPIPFPSKEAAESAISKWYASKGTPTTAVEEQKKEAVEPEKPIEVKLPEDTPLAETPEAAAKAQALEDEANSLLSQLNEMGETISPDLRQKIEEGDSDAVLDLKNLVRDLEKQKASAEARAAQKEQELKLKEQELKLKEQELEEQKTAQGETIAVEEGATIEETVDSKGNTTYTVKPPRRVDDEKPIEDTEAVAAKHAYTEAKIQELKDLGYDIPPLERQSYADMLWSVKTEKNSQESADAIVQRALNDPMSISPRDHLRMLLHLAETEATLDALRDELDGFDPSQKGSSKIIATKQRDLDIQREKYGDVLIALHLSGTEIARAMVSRKMYVDKSDFTPKRIIARMERASPTGKVGKETQQKATEIGNKLQDVQSKIQKKTEQKQKRSDSNKKKRAGKAVSKQSSIAKGEQKVRSRKRVNKAKAFLADNGFCV